MDFNLTDDRRMLADSLGRYLADQPIERRIETAYAPPFHDTDVWSGLFDLGALHALAPESAGGYGGAGGDIAVVFEALGRALRPEPMLAALMSATALVALGRPVDDLLTGAETYALATGEPDAPWEIDGIETRAAQTGDEWRLSGRKSVVHGGHSASRLLISARVGDAIGLFEADAADAQITPYGMIDGGGAAEVFLDDAPATLLAEDARASLEAAETAGIVALCAEAVGVMDVLKDYTVEYLKTRKQFGRAIGDFQVLQHRAVDMAVEIEQARSITILAADRMDAASASMAKNLIGRAGKHVAEEAIQMHGGIAMTWEYPVSHYAKRLIMIGHQLGDADEHLRRLVQNRTPS